MTEGQLEHVYTDLDRKRAAARRISARLAQIMRTCDAEELAPEQQPDGPIWIRDARTGEVLAVVPARGGGA